MIHKTAIVSSKAKIGNNVEIGAFTIVHDEVQIGDNTKIESYCEIGYPTALAEGLPLTVGRDSLVRSHSTLYQGSEFGESFVTGHRVTIREKTIAGKNFQVGTLGDIQGHCEIGNFVKFHSNVHVGQHSKIGNCVWIFPYVVLTNDPHPPSEFMLGVTLEDFSVLATMSVILPGVRVGEGALVAAHSCVSRDVEPDTVVAGSPAKFICETEKIKLKDGSGRSAYPWRRHFHRGYSPELIDAWNAEFSSANKGQTQ